MAGIAFLQLSPDGKPQLTTEDHSVTGVASGGQSPDKLQADGSPKSLAKAGTDVVSVSPQGKGVGVFGLEGSPGICGHESDGPLKDPKVSRNSHTKSFCVHMYFFNCHLSTT